MELAKTLRYRREEITTPFLRDADDTVPVELYSTPYDRIEIEPTPPDVLPSRSFQLVLAILILCGTFALGVCFAFVLLSG